MKRFVVRLLLAASVVQFADRAAKADAPQRYFTVESRDGAWWFVDPAGLPVLSLGVNVLAPGPDKTKYDATRPEYAAWRFYASDAAWADATTQRLQQWRFNTVGGWAHRELRKGAMPYTEVLHLGAELGVPWNDLFAESFATGIDRLAEQRVAPHRDDAQLIGWFSDNELGWYADLLLTFHSTQPATSVTRQRLMRLLEEHYEGEFASLGRDFAVDAGVPNVAVDSFEKLRNGGSLKLVAGGKGQAVVTKFAELLADRYYGVVGEAIRRHDPNHLILGDRYHGYCPDAVVRASARHVDVVSTNYDWPRGVDGYLPSFYLRRLHALTDKPVLVTEYYATATENRSGNPNTGDLFMVVADQEQRAEVVRRRLEMFADEPYIVGAHWFAFADEPPKGRPRDGEDYNFGLVDIEDQPYAEVTAVMRELHGASPSRHAGGGATKAASDEAASEQLAAPQLPAGTPIDGVDATLLSQLDVPPSADAGLGDLKASWDAGAIYLTLAGNHCVMEEAYAERPAPLGEGLAWTVAWATNSEGSTASDVELQMLGPNAALARGTCKFANWQRGVRYGVTLALSAEAVGRDVWQAGDHVTVRGALRDRRDERQTTWATELILVAADEGEREAARVAHDDERQER